MMFDMSLETFLSIVLGAGLAAVWIGWIGELMKGEVDKDDQ